MLPPQAKEPSDADLARARGDAVLQKGMLGAYKHLYGAGDVVWPASVALARLLAHVPSFSAGLRVLELGCGLGPFFLDGTKDSTSVGNALQPLSPSGLIQTPSGAGIDEEELVGHGFILPRGCDTVGREVSGCASCSASV